MIEITEAVARIVLESGTREGIVNVSGLGLQSSSSRALWPTCSVPLEDVVPANEDYAYNDRSCDRNGYAHLRSALMGTAKSPRSRMEPYTSARGSKPYPAISTTARVNAKSLSPSWRDSIVARMTRIGGRKPLSRPIARSDQCTSL